MAKSKYTLKSGPFSFVFWPEISTSLRDPLGCSDLSQIFFGSSPSGVERERGREREVYLDDIVDTKIHSDTQLDINKNSST